MSTVRRTASPRELRRLTIDRWRAEGSQGARITPHRALLSHRFPIRRMRSILILPVAYTLAIILFHREIVLLWSQVIRWSIELTDTYAQLGWTRTLGGLRLPMDMVWLDMSAGAPSPAQWWTCAAVTLFLALLSLGLPSRMLPIAYVLRVHAIVIAVSLLYFVLMPNSFTYSLSDHICMLLVMFLLLALLIPWIFALTYSVLGVTLANKALLTFLGVFFLLLFAPLHAFSHALVLHHGSLLYQPLLFLLMGVFPPLMAMVAFYSWAMTWPRGAA
jgi:hypothetical protein